ncbi:MAG: thioredoxin-disulfide reductase [Dysgonamonadaceae bacterium]|jgi:thioredoxin reductase (NADPH)|nr:thioredoxin-disulfide reductase [Dysgonamonadaceae bacterium]
MEKTKCVIIGSGPAGLTAAIYASRAGIAPVIYEGMTPGGQLTTTSVIENFPGYPDGTTGDEMMEDLKRQAQKFGADIRPGVITGFNPAGQQYRLTVDGEKEIETQTVIICTGASAKYLGLADEQKYAGQGVSACAVCDGFFYRKKTVAVVGGGDSACEEALYLAGLAEKVYLIVRKNRMRASQIMQDRAEKHPGIEIMYSTEIEGLFGDGAVEGARLVRFAGTDSEERIEISIDGLFLAIGHHPNSAVFRDHVAVDDSGYILTESGTTRTALPGVFAAGDVSDPRYRQAVTSAGSGCIAALEVEKYLAYQ